MADAPSDLRYTFDNVWARLDADGVVELGVTDLFLQRVGEVAFVELPEVGATYKANRVVGAIESVGTSVDFTCPIDGTVVAVNSDLENNPELINSQPYST